MQRSVTMMSATGFRCYCPWLSSHLPPSTIQISALLKKCGAESSGLRRRRRWYCSFSSELVSQEVEETREGTFRRARLLERLLERRWLLEQPNTKISKVLVSNSTKESELQWPEHLGQMQFSLQKVTSELESKNDGPMFYVIRDDLLHPLLGGNKLRKLDAMLTLLEDWAVTDVITCGGCQSAHTAALACACAERGMRAHLLLRGEKPRISTGYNLVSSMYGHCIYVPRSAYADRPAMFRKYAALVAGSSGSITWLDELRDGLTMGHPAEKKVVVVQEGAGDAVALLGLIRLVHYLSQSTVFGTDCQLHIVVDTGTGTTAIGLALGIVLLRLPWTVTGVILTDTVEEYEGHKRKLIFAFCEQFSLTLAEALQLPLSWKERWQPRKFGNVFPGEVRTCQSIARQTGILLDPIYTLAGWEAATRLSVENAGNGQGRPTVVMLHTGGTLGLFGLAQRYPTEFN